MATISKTPKKGAPAIRNPQPAIARRAKGRWRCLRVTKVFSNPWVRLEDHRVRTPNGREFQHVVVHAGPSVLIVPVTAGGRIIITREYRYPTRAWNYELPGGGTERLRPEAAARKELREETGYVARRVERIGKFVVYSGLSSEFCHVFLATGLRRRSQELERTEHITVRAVTWAELQRMIAANRFRDGMSLAALMMARHRLPLRQVEPPSHQGAQKTRAPGVRPSEVPTQDSVAASRAKNP